MNAIAPYFKSIFAVIGALIAGLILGLDDNSLTTAEVLQAIGQAVGVAGVVFAAPRNRTTTVKAN